MSASGENIGRSRSMFLAGSLVMTLIALAFELLVAREFGWKYAAIVGVILCAPIGDAARISFRWQQTSRSQLIRLAVLVFVTILALGFSIPHWYDLGAHDTHLAHLEVVEIGQLLRADPTFQNVTITENTSKGYPYSLVGSVSSEADRLRVKALADSSKHVRWGFEVRTYSPDP